MKDQQTPTTKLHQSPNFDRNTKNYKTYSGKEEESDPQEKKLVRHFLLWGGRILWTGLKGLRNRRLANP